MRGHNGLKIREDTIRGSSIHERTQRVKIRGSFLYMRGHNGLKSEVVLYIQWNLKARNVVSTDYWRVMQ